MTSDDTQGDDYSYNHHQPWLLSINKKHQTVMKAQTVNFDQLIARGCGIDVHKNLIVATIKGEGIREETRCCDGFTESLEQLRDWLKENGITHVAMESTGVYWKPVFNILEEDFEVILVNARHIKNVPGIRRTRRTASGLPSCCFAGC